MHISISATFSRKRIFSFFKIHYYMQHYQLGNESATQVSTHLHRILSSFSWHLLLCFKLVQDILILKYLNGISSQILKKHYHGLALTRNTTQMGFKFGEPGWPDTRKRTWVCQVSVHAMHWQLAGQQHLKLLERCIRTAL